MTDFDHEPILQVWGAGGSRQQDSPEVAPDSIQSTAKAQILYLIGEGPIAGFPTTNAAEYGKFIYFDDEVVMRPSGALNFKGMSFFFKTGTQSQLHIGGFSNVESEENVGTKVTKTGGPITRSVTDSDVDLLRFRFTVPALQKQKDNGDIVGTSIAFRLQVAPNGQPFSTVKSLTLSGKASSAFQADYTIRLTGSAPWNVRVIRDTNDNDDDNTLQDDLIWQALVSIIEAKPRYPNSALFGVRFDAKQFKNVPRISCELKGLELWVPHNYNPDAKTYSGAFNGTLVKAYSNNPAWALYTILRDTRFGCGRYIDSSLLDVWSFYSIGQYCDESVPNGYGGFEPRFAVNCYIENRDDAYNVLNALASAFRGMLYWANGTIYAIADQPQSTASARLYTEANVIQEFDEDGRCTKPPFVYSGTSLKTRHTVALVSWSDPKDSYKQKVEYVEDRAALLKYGYRATEVVAFGCTSRGQSRRTGKWILFSEQLETETVTFSVATEGLLVSPGNVIKIADPARSGNRWGGRIISSAFVSGAWEVILDAPVVTGQSGYVISITGADGLGVEYACTLVNSTRARVPTLAGAPTPGSVWILASSTLEPQLFKVVNVVEQNDNTYEITAIAHNPGKYDFVEEDEPLPESQITNLNDPTAPPLPVQIDTVAISLDGLTINLVVTWDKSTSVAVTSYQVEYKLSTDVDWIVYETTSLTSSSIPAVTNGATYDFRVLALSTNGQYSDYSSVVSKFVNVPRGSGNIALKKPVFSGVGLRIITGSGNIGLKKPVFFGLDFYGGAGDVGLKKPTFSGVGSKVHIGSGDIGLKKPAIAGNGGITITGSGDIALKKPVFTAGTSYGIAAYKLDFSDPINSQYTVIITRDLTDA